MATPLHCDNTLRFCTNRNVVSFRYDEVDIFQPSFQTAFIHASLASWYFAVHQLFPKITVFNCED
jgi:hypothetical protein